MLAGVALAPLLLGASLSAARAQVAPTPSTPPNTAPAPAATAGAPPPTSLGDVVVTARKVTENVQRAPASIVAVSGVELQQQAITNPQGLEKTLPSASLRTQGPVTQSFIRGVGAP